jgi:hypothetical protein
MKHTRVPRSVTDLFPQVTKLVKSRKPVSISVNEKDCATGMKMQATECAMAKAIKRQFQADGVIIRLSTSYVIKGDKAIAFRTPDTVAREIVSFDRNHDFAAGQYHLGPVNIKRPKSYGETRRHPSGPKKHPTVVHRTARVRRMEKE